MSSVFLRLLIYKKCIIYIYIYTHIKSRVLFLRIMGIVAECFLNIGPDSVYYCRLHAALAAASVTVDKKSTINCRACYVISGAVSY